MQKTIDCLLIGHNEVDFSEYIKNIEKMGKHSGAYHDLSLSFLQYKDKPYHASGIFNLICSQSEALEKSLTPIRSGETFSATISYLGKYLHWRGFTFDYVNSFQDEKDELADKLENQHILTIAITTTLYVSVFPIMEIMEFIKKYNQTARIIIGGPFVSTNIRSMDTASLEYLFKSIDADFYVNSSQGEATLVRLIKALKTNFPLEKINNIYYKTGNNSGYKSTPILKENNQLSKNMVDWDLFTARELEYCNIRTSISCPFSCAFCGFPQHAGKYQTANIEAIERELNSLEKIKSIKNLYFIDDTINIPVNRFKKFLKMLIKNQYQFRWQSQIRCQFIDRETVELMKESGCEGVFLGLESGSKQILENMNKAASVEDYLDGIALLKEYGIITYGSFIIGFPGETEETVIDTVKLIEESEIDFYRTQLWYCERITPIWKQREKYHINGSNFEWSHATMDSEKACRLIEEIFFSIKKSIWLPQCNFDFVTLFHLTGRGIHPDRVKYFIKVFNRGIEEKLIHPNSSQVNNEFVTQLANTIIASGNTAPPINLENFQEAAVIQEEDLTADFDLD